jgi:hypothetical protein
VKIEPGLLNNGVFNKSYRINEKHTHRFYNLGQVLSNIIFSFFSLFLVLQLRAIIFVILEGISVWIVGEILLIFPSTSSIEQF